MARFPVIARDSGISSSSFRHNWKLRPSFHRMAGRSGLWSAPSSVAPCICPASPMPCTRARRSSGSARMAASVACHQSWGSCSDHKGKGRDTFNGAFPVASTLPSCATITALTPDVPISMPRNISLHPLLTCVGSANIRHHARGLLNLSLPNRRYKRGNAEDGRQKRFAPQNRRTHSCRCRARGGRVPNDRVPRYQP